MPTKKTSTKTKLLSLLRAKGLDAESLGRNEIVAKVSLENIIGGYTGTLKILIDDMGVVGIYHFNTKIPQKLLSRVGEYYLRINSILKRGVIGLDYENGETRFRNSMSMLDFEKEPESEFAWFLRMPTIVLARFLPHLNKIITENLSPEYVFKECTSDIP